MCPHDALKRCNGCSPGAQARRTSADVADAHRGVPFAQRSHMALRKLPVVGRWPIIRQIATRDATGLGPAARSPRTDGLRPRTETADRVVRSVCPYCAVGCGQLVYVRDDKITDIEGDPESPISEGCLCPKGAATMQL